jgi:NADP-dependent 3-hydroxy acid dehydrogenase YdfG
MRFPPRYETGLSGNGGDPPAQRHVRVGVLEPGGVATELGSHNRPEIRGEMIDPFYQRTEVLAPEDIADGVAYMVTRARHAAISELWMMPTDQA